MSERLHRTRLLFGEQNLQILQHSTVMVIGCGAVGSFAIEALARTGILHLVLLDFDKIAESNINRQLFALDSTINLFKTDTAKKRILDINPNINVECINTFFDKNTTLQIKPDFVIDAIDSIKSKIAIYKWCQQNQIPFISSMGAARKTNPSEIKFGTIIKTSVCPLASKIRKLVKTEHIKNFPVVYSTEPATKLNSKEFGSVITVTGIFGLMLANYAIQYLIKKRRMITLNQKKVVDCFPICF